MNETKTMVSGLTQIAWRFKFALLMGLHGCVWSLVLFGTIWFFHYHIEVVESEPTESDLNRWAIVHYIQSWTYLIYQAPFHVPMGPLYNYLGSAGHFLAGPFWAVVGLPLDIGFWWHERKSGERAQKRSKTLLVIVLWLLSITLTLYIVVFTLAYLIVV